MVQKKIFCAKKFLGLFVHLQRWLVQKNTGPNIFTNTEIHQQIQRQNFIVNY